ncbi:T9SS type A sorting domain-containing protein [Flavobacterium gelatinilyticum]|uniref:T9SS type A sorting domain-containing protein n=1 Tax=Flavobacterium gelatinilyticum TaxID=3003260 RepID=UPI002481509C|nr:T9SS type A sorting domain-containing protein [Flavobacterium gelatinilyticum]
MKTQLLLLLLLANFSIYAQTNLVPNGEFEKWTSSTVLSDWTTQNNVTQNNTEYWEGFNSVKLSFTNSASIPKITTQVPLKAGITYVVKFKYKYLSSNYNSSHPIVLNISKNGSSTTLSNSIFAKDNNWTTVETTFIPDQNLSYDLSISLNTLDNIGFNANIDHLQVYAKGTEQYTLIPDLSFEKNLIALGIDSGTTDGKVLTSSISTLTSLNITGNGNGVGLIKDLTGIQDFRALTLLICQGQQLTTLNLTTNTALVILNCQNNLLTSLDISKNPALTTIICNNNSLTNLDISEKLGLNNLQCGSNKLTSLDISKNTALITLKCEKNLLTSLDITKHIALVTLDCSGNLLTSLDASKNIALTSLYCQDNSLTSVNIKNGNNKAFYWNFIHHLSFYGNKDLKCITVDDPVYSSKNWAGNREYESTFALACDGQYTAIPDPNFEQHIIDLGLDSGKLDGKVLTANISTVKTLSVFSRNISDLTGIEDFTALTSLSCNSNKLSSLDISKNIALTELRCSNNPQLSFLDVSNNVNLNYLYCDNLNLKTLNLKNNLKLIELNCSNNYLTSLEIPHNRDFTYLDCSFNRLSNLDVSKNFKLNYLDCSYNKIIGLDLSENYLLTTLRCSKNNLFNLNLRSGNNVIMKIHNLGSNPNLKCISVDKETVNNSLWETSKDPKASYYNGVCSENIPYTLIPDPSFEEKLIALGIDTDGKNGKVLTANICNVETLDVASSNISSLKGIEDFTSLTYLDCGSNKINSPDFSENILLTTLYYSKNSAKTLNLSKNEFLTFLDCSTNELTRLDLSTNRALTYLNLSKNSFASLDVTRHTALTTLNCADNKLTILDITKNLSLSAFYCNDNLLETIDISKNTAVSKLNCQNNKLISLNLKNGNNTNFDLTDSNFTNNPLLTCINVDDENYSNKNWSDKKDVTANFNNACNTAYTLIPDINFEKKLIALNIDYGVPDGRVYTVKISSITNINLSNASISNLTGIQDFIALNSLNCESNQLTTIDLSKNSALVDVDLDDNKITNINTTNNINLENLKISNNELESINVSNNSNLKQLFCMSNKLTTLDVSKNKKLKDLRCASNQLTNLDLSANPLWTINCSRNNLSTLNLKNGSNRYISIDMINLSLTENPLLKCIQVDDADYSTKNWAERKDPGASFSTNCASLGLEDSVFAHAAIYPNPTKGELSIQNVNLEKADVYNVLGQLVKSFTLNSSNTDNTISLNGLPKGVYFVYLINQDAATAKKVIVE